MKRGHAFILLLALPALLLPGGCGKTVAPAEAQREPTPIVEGTLAEISAPPLVMGQPEGASYPEISEGDAAWLYNACRKIAGFTDGEIPAPELSISKEYSPGEGCNVYAVHGRNLSVWMRTFDARIIDMAVLGYPEGPGVVNTVTEEDALSISRWLWERLDEAEDECIAAIPGFPQPERPFYRIAGATTNEQSLGRWSVQFERVSDTGIPYYGQAGSVMLQPDGTLYMLVLHELDACSGTVPFVTEGDALAIARAIHQEQLSRYETDVSWQGLRESALAFPDSAQLVYSGGFNQRQNRLTWRVSGSIFWEISIDAATGEVTKMSFPY